MQTNLFGPDLHAGLHAAEQAYRDGLIDEADLPRSSSLLSFLKSELDPNRYRHSQQVSALLGIPCPSWEHHVGYTLGLLILRRVSVTTPIV